MTAGYPATVGEIRAMIEAEFEANPPPASEFYIYLDGVHYQGEIGLAAFQERYGDELDKGGD